MRVLAVDHGLSRSGLATCDPSGTIVRPLDVVEPTDAAAVAGVAEEIGAERIVVGLPVGLDGAEGEQAGLARRFAEELGELAAAPVALYDERLTTALAGGSRRAGARGHPDSLAAAHLLESYLVSLERG